MRNYFIIPALFAAGALSLTAQSTPAFNYAEALQKSIFFYDAQRSGPLGSDNRVSWRGNSAVTDGSDHNVDLTGGWYDAGDNVKFGFPMAGSATLLAWSVLEYPSAYSDSKQLAPMLANLRWVSDYFMKASATPNELWGQVGNGSADHAWWGASEVMSMARPSYKVTATCGGSDLAGETAAALAAASLVFKGQGETEYAAKLLARSKSLYAFADTYRGKYSDCITDAAAFYQSWSGYLDELTWGAAWLYRATSDPAYLEKAKTLYATLPLETGTQVRPYKWTHNWDDKSFGTYVLMSQLTSDPVYRTDAERWLDYWTSGVDGQKVRYTPGGLAFLDQWGSLRYAANTSFLAFVYADFLNSSKLDTTRAARYTSFAERQVNYILGDNPRRSSYEIGFGTNAPKNPHHRTAHGSWADSLSSPTDSVHTLYGALVGGPNASDAYTDSRSDYVSNEVATDYNSGFVGALARMYARYGGEPLANFPVPETPSRDEVFAQAKINAQGGNFIEIAAWLTNQTAWPARVTDNLSLRYFFTLDSESPADITVSSAFNECGKPSSPIQWAGSVYYVEIDCAGVKIAPAGQSAYQKQVQFRIASTGTWTPANDWSGEGLSTASAPVKTTKIVLYDHSARIWGEEPAGGTPRPLDISTLVQLPGAVAAKQYSTTLRASGGVAPYGQWEIKEGQLPEGLQLNGTTGEISGMPVAVAMFPFVVAITDAEGAVVTKQLTLTVGAAPPLVITTTAMKAARTGSSYSVALQAEGGVPPYAWTVTEGKLPEGLTLNGGMIEGTPVSEGKTSITLEVADNLGSKITGSFELVVGAPSTVLPGTLTAQYRTNITQPTTNQVSPQFKINNAGADPVPMSEITIRYHFTPEQSKALSYWCDWAVAGCANTRGRFTEDANGDFYFEISFTDAAGTIPAGGTSGEIQTRIAKEDWSDFNQANDYSFDPTKSSFADAERVTLHRNGALIWGVAPTL